MSGSLLSKLDDERLKVVWAQCLKIFSRKTRAQCDEVRIFAELSELLISWIALLWIKSGDCRTLHSAYAATFLFAKKYVYMVFSNHGTKILRVIR